MSIANPPPRTNAQRRHDFGQAFRLRLEAAMQATGKTAKEIAAEASVSLAALSLWRSGDQFPNLGSLPGLAHALGIELVQLFGGGVRPDERRPVPIYTSLHPDATGWFHLDLRRPPEDAVAPRALGLSGHHVLALAMPGDSMSPWREAGQLVYFTSEGQIGIDNHAVIVRRDGTARVLRVIAITSEIIVGEQYCGWAEHTIPRADIAHVRRVIEWEEAAGL